MSDRFCKGRIVTVDRDDLGDAENADQQCGDTGYNPQATDDSHHRLPVKSPDDKSWHPQEAEHRTEERKHWRVQNTVAMCGIILTLAAAGGGIASAIYANRALEASQEGVKAAWQAVEAAQRQATAAEAQLAIAKKADIAAQIPNLSVQMVFPSNSTLKPGFPLVLAAMFVNGGPGIAYNLKAYGKIAFLKESKVNKDSFSDKFPDDAGDGFVLLPQTNDTFTHSTSFDRSLTAADLSSTCDDCGVAIYYYGEGIYHDSLGNTYIREYCGKLQVIDKKTKNFALCDFHNRLLRMLKSQGVAISSSLMDHQ